MLKLGAYRRARLAIFVSIREWHARFADAKTCKNMQITWSSMFYEA